MVIPIVTTRAKAFCLLLAFIAAAASATGQPGETGSLFYQTPPEPIASALEAPGPPFVLTSPSRDRIAILERSALPSIAELAEPELRLAGLTINPRNNGPSRSSSYSSLSFTDIATGQTRRARLPSGARLINPQWSPDGRHLALLLLNDDGVELWTVAAATGASEQRATSINAAFPVPYQWFASSSELLVRMIPENRAGTLPAVDAPSAPVVQETSGEAAPVGTIQNLLANGRDEARFEHYFTSQVAVVDVKKGEPRTLGSPGLIVEASPSPDGRFILERRLKRPFSYSVGALGFPQEIRVLDLGGVPIRTIADRAAPVASLTEVAPGPRVLKWRADVPSTLFWAQRSEENPHRDQLYLLAAPFQAPPQRIAEVPMRFQNIYWTNGAQALVTGMSAEPRAELRMIVDSSGQSAPRLLQQRLLQDDTDLGTILEWDEDIAHVTPDRNGVIVQTRNGLGRVDLGSGIMTQSWSERPGERLFAVLDRGGRRLLSWREELTTPPNLHLVEAAGDRVRRLTDFGDPLPQYAQMQVRSLSYRRSDGRALRGTLYLPKGHVPVRDGPLPSLIWAYPASRTGNPSSTPAASATHAFVRPTGFDNLPILLTGRGYAVFEADMPVFGSAESPPNDSHVPQLVANAEAAIATLVDIGVASPDRVAVGGHSYGAAMVANLLAHSDLFRTGIALSGAYNRTLTPFGFQASERRSLWQAPETYLAMSPFVHADRINEPILLVHGAADDNSGTLPLQSERLYSALAGLGGKSRFVLLPHEGHQYRARESVMHLMWEMDRWLAIHLGPPRRD